MTNKVKTKRYCSKGHAKGYECEKYNCPNLRPTDAQILQHLEVMMWLDSPVRKRLMETVND